MGTHQNRLDAKGRVSVPAPFRSSLRAEGEGDGPVTVVLRPSHKFLCIEGWPPPTFLALTSGLNRLPQFSDAHDDLSAALFATAYAVEIDKEGRIALNDDLVDHAGLGGQVAFVGNGDTFQIWDPAAAKQRQEEARSVVRARGLSLPGAAAA